MNNYKANEQTNEQIAERIYPGLTNLYTLVIRNDDGTTTKPFRTKRAAQVKLYQYVIDNWSRLYESGDMSDQERRTWDKLAADGVPYPLLRTDPLNSIEFYFELMKDKQEIQIGTLNVDETFNDVDNTPKKNIRAGTVCDPTFLELAATDGS